MKTSVSFRAFLFGFLFVVIAFAAIPLSVKDVKSAAEVLWVPDGIPMTERPGDDAKALVVADGAGGAVVLWKHDNLRVCAQHVDTNGNLLWSKDGLVVFGSLSGTVTGFDAISDGAGGVFVVCDEASGKVHGQHIDGNGDYPWGQEGVLLHEGSNVSRNPRICSDAAGGFLAAWENYTPTSGYAIIAQRVDAGGNALWNDFAGGGSAVSEGIAERRMLQVVHGDAGTIICAWEDERTGNRNVYAQKVDENGDVQWAADGVTVGEGGWHSLNSCGITSDGAGGCIIGWERRVDSPDIYAQSLDENGVARWTGGGISVCSYEGAQWRPQVTTNDSGGAYIAWDDYRNNESSIYCQNILSDGSYLWMADGFKVTVQPEDQREVRVAPDGLGGVILVWMDSRHGTKFEVYAQNLSSEGYEKWASTGVRVCSKDNGHSFPALANAEDGAAIIAWRDKRNTQVSGYDIYAQKIITTGDPIPDSWYFAEGTTRDGFEQYFSIQNANAATSEVKITYMLYGGETREQRVEVPGRSRATVYANDFLGSGVDNSAMIETANDVPVVVERPMYFNYESVWTGGHDVVGANQPREEWYFAEGTTREGFKQYICLQNPKENDAQVEIVYMLENSQTKTQNLTVGAKARVTVAVHEELGSGYDNSALVKSNNGVPLVAERPMYFNYKNAWTGGHCKGGAAQSDTVWFFAEGTTREWFEQYLCIQNPQNKVADVKITYMLEGGNTKEQTLAVQPLSRETVNVNSFLGTGVDNSTKIESINGTRIVAERPMYFNYRNVWTGGHDVMGANAPASTWFFAEGTTVNGFEEWICIQNPNDYPVEALMTYMLEDGTNELDTFALLPTSRYTVFVNDKIIGQHDVSVRVESADGSEIIVERPMYFNYKNAWTGGHNVMGY